MIKAIVFDLDDTLIATYEESYRNHFETASALGLEMPSEKEFFKHYNLTWERLVKTLWPNADYNKYVETYGKKSLKYPLIAGVGKVLKTLKEKGILLGVLTTRDANSTNALLEKNGVAQHFDLVVCCSESIHKPNLLVFENVLHKLNYYGVGKKEFIYVGDSLNDFKAAYNARINFVAVLTGWIKKEEFLENGLAEENIIESIHQLPEYVDHLNKRRKEQ